MRAIAFCLVTFLVSSALPADNLDDIALTAFDYVAGSHHGDTKRLKHAIHSGMTGRLLRNHDGRPRLERASARRLIRTARRKERNPPASGVELIILDVDSDIASVKALAYGSTAYLHLARIENRWLVVDALRLETPDRHR